MGNQKIYWIGHGSWKFVTAAGTVIYIDPWLADNPSSKITLEDTKDADIVCVTHGHNDHIGTGDGIDIARETGAAFVALADLCTYASRYGVPYDQQGGATGVGGSVRIKDCVIHCVQALHTSDIWGYEWKEDGVSIMPGGGCCGFVIEPDEGDTVYFAGDTGLFGDMKLIGELYKPSIAVLPVGDKYVMGPREAAVAAEFIGAKTVIPGHYSTFPAIVQDMDNFKKLVAARAPYTNVHVMDPGDTYEF